MKHVTLAERWAVFEAATMPTSDPRFTAEVRQMVRLTFYAGASYMNDFMTQELTNISDDSGVERIESVQQELRDFARVETALSRFMRGELSRH